MARLKEWFKEKGREHRAQGVHEEEDEGCDGGVRVNF